MSHDPLLEPWVPEDFDAFWAEVVEEAARVPLNFYREPAVGIEAANGHRLEQIHYQGMGEEWIHGWIAYPAGAHRLPAFVWIPPYGRESVLPNAYGTRAGFVSLSMNLHGEPAFHQEKYTPERGYFAEDAELPHTWVFRRLVQNVLISLRVLQAQSEVAEEQIGAMGMSQGGGLALWASTLSPIVKAVCADMPFLGAMPWVLARPIHRYPLKELLDFMETVPIGRERLIHTLSYFDTVNMATRVTVPTLISLGLKDPAVRPEQARAVYDALASERRQLVEYDWGHDWTPEMVAKNAIWLTEYLTRA